MKGPLTTAWRFNQDGTIGYIAGGDVTAKNTTIVSESLSGEITEKANEVI